MQEGLVLSVLLPFVWASTGQSRALISTATCGTQGYDPTLYICYETTVGSTLCPLNDGVPYSPCGSACYFDMQYSCVNETLSPLPIRDGPFSLRVLAPLTGYDNAKIQASKEHFWIGGNNSQYCPDTLPDGTCTTTDTTVMAANGLVGMVPGGQEIFIQTDGHMAFTEAHNASMPELLYEEAGVAYESGGYFAPNGSQWFACMPSDAPKGGARHLLMDVPGMNYRGCDVIYLYVENHPSEISNVWEYL